MSEFERRNGGGAGVPLGRKKRGLEGSDRSKRGRKRGDYLFAFGGGDRGRRQKDDYPYDDRQRRSFRRDDDFEDVYYEEIPPVEDDLPIQDSSEEEAQIKEEVPRRSEKPDYIIISGNVRLQEELAFIGYGVRYFSVSKERYVVTMNKEEAARLLKSGQGAYPVAVFQNSEDGKMYCLQQVI